MCRIRNLIHYEEFAGMIIAITATFAGKFHVFCVDPMATQLFIWNEGSGKSHESSAVCERFASRDSTRSLRLSRAVNLKHEIATAVNDGCDHVVAAGGDGTVNAVVNAMMTIEPKRRPSLSIIPLGTANDFAGTLCLPDVDDNAVSDPKRIVPIDVVRISSDNFERFYANMAAGGNCVRVSETMTDEMKADWGAFCYLRGAVGVLADMKTFAIRADCDGEIIECDSWGVLVANGKTNAGRIPVAPLASPADGLLDVIIIREGTVIDMVDMISNTLLSSFLDSDKVTFRQVKHLSLRSDPGMRFTIDGEVIDEEPVNFEVIPGAIKMVVGKDFS